MNVAQETLGFRRAGLSPALSLLMSAFALPIPPAALTSHLHRPTERSPTMLHLIQTSGPHLRRSIGRLDRSGSPTLGASNKEFESDAASLASVHSLSPVTSSAQDDSTSE